MTSNILTGPPTNYTVNSTLGQFFFDSAEKFGNRICQIDAHGNIQESFSSAKLRSTRVALALLQRGITFKDVVATCSTVTLDSVIPILASFYIGAKVANLDTSLSVNQTKHLLWLVSPRVIFVEESSISLIEESLINATFDPIIVVFGESQKYTTFSDLVKPQKNEEEFRPVPVDIHETGLIFFSSGTTGFPKAICHSHYSFLYNVYCFYQVMKGDAILSFSSFYWISGMWTLTCSFMAGGYRIIANQAKAEDIFKIIEKYKVTFIFMAPILTYKVTNYEKKKDYDTSSVYSILVGGTPISPTQLQKIANTFQHSFTFFAYGLTETGIVSSFTPHTDQKLLTSKIGSAGKIAMGVTIKIVSLETNKVLGPNERGEIYVKTEAQMKEYYKANSADAIDEDGFLKTGDVGYYDEDGCLYVVERVKEMFKYLSWHIVPTLIESVLLEHPAVEEAAVFGIPQSEEIGEIPAACIVLKSGCNTSKEDIEEFVAARVSDREKLRGGVFFVKKLSRTTTGKLMRKQIRASIIDTISIH